MKSLCALLLGLGIVISLRADDNWYKTWTYRQMITIPAAKVTGSHAAFPVLVTEANVQPSLFANAQADGDDILFTADDGKTKIPHEIELYDADDDKLAAWVNVPAISSTANTVLYVYYGKASAANQQDAANVWTNGFVGVWHMSAVNGVNYDSTTNANHGVTNGVVDVSDAGKIAGGNEFFTNVISSVNTGAKENDPDMDLGNSNLSLSLWCKPVTPIYGTDYLLSDGYNGGASNFGGFDVMHSSTSLILYFAQADKVRKQIQFGHGFYVWKHVVVTWDVGLSRVEMYQDAVWKGGADCVGHGLYNISTIKIGSNSGGTLGSSFNGSIDEARISRVARSAGWIATEHANQSAPETFASASDEERLPWATQLVIR